MHSDNDDQSPPQDTRESDSEGGRDEQNRSEHQARDQRRGGPSDRNAQGGSGQGNRSPSRDPRQQRGPKPEIMEDEDLDEENMSDEEEQDEPRRRRGFSSAKELLLDEVRARALRAVNPKLRSHLTGRVIVQTDNDHKRYLFDWSSEQVTVEETDAQEAECIINVTEDSLLKIAAGDLNPQIGMLCDKIKVKGQLGMAIYFFNLVAPRVQQ